MSAEQIIVALNRAFQLGQDYWRLSDSESYSDNKKASKTWDKFNVLVDEIIKLDEQP